MRSLKKKHRRQGGLKYLESTCKSLKYALYLQHNYQFYPAVLGIITDLEKLLKPTIWQQLINLAQPGKTPFFKKKTNPL